MTYFVEILNNSFIPNFIEIHQGDRLQFISNNNFSNIIVQNIYFESLIFSVHNYWYPGVSVNETFWCYDLNITICQKTYYFFYMEVFFFFNI